MNPVPTERRCGPRLPLQRLVRFHVGDRRVDGRVQDISRRGLRLHAGDLPPVNATTRLDLALEEGRVSPRLRVTGQVMWREHGAAGIHFVGFEGDSLQQLDDLLSRYLLFAKPAEVRDFLARIDTGEEAISEDRLSSDLDSSLTSYLGDNRRDEKEEVAPEAADPTQ